MQFQICRHMGFLDSAQHHTLVTLSGGTVILCSTVNTAKLSGRCSKVFPWSRKSSSSRAMLEILYTVLSIQKYSLWPGFQGAVTIASARNEEAKVGWWDFPLGAFAAMLGVPSYSC